MHEDRHFGIPEAWYYQNMERDYRKFGFDLSVLRLGLQNSRARTKGARVRLISMDDVQAPPAGTEGTVQYVDDAGTIHVQWDTGDSSDWYPAPMNGNLFNKCINNRKMTCYYVPLE